MCLDQSYYLITIKYYVIILRFTAVLLNPQQTKGQNCSARKTQKQNILNKQNQPLRKNTNMAMWA